MSIEIKSLTLGVAATHCYIIGDTVTGRAVLIDPVDQAETLLDAAQKANWQIALILATHGHFDHILASKALKDATGAPFYIHHKGVEWLENLPQQGQIFGLGRFPPAAEPDRLLGDESETIQLDGITLDTLFTPGHSPDHLSFVLHEQHTVIGGDALFASTIGRTDLPGADYDQLMQSITQKLLPLGDDFRVLPGHMHETTIGRERRTNPFIIDYLKT